MSSQYKAVLKRLIEARNAAGLSQSQAGSLVGLATASVSDIERGKNALGVERLFQFVEVYGVSIEWLLTGVNSKFDPQVVIEAAGRVTRDAAKIIHLLTMSANN